MMRYKTTILRSCRLLMSLASLSLLTRSEPMSLTRSTVLTIYSLWPRMASIARLARPYVSKPRATDFSSLSPWLLISFWDFFRLFFTRFSSSPYFWGCSNSISSSSRMISDLMCCWRISSYQYFAFSSVTLVLNDFFLEQGGIDFYSICIRTI